MYFRKSCKKFHPREMTIQSNLHVCHGIWNPLCLDCLFNSYSSRKQGKHQSSTLSAICEGTGEFPSHRASSVKLWMQKVFLCYDIISRISSSSPHLKQQSLLFIYLPLVSSAGTPINYQCYHIPPDYIIHRRQDRLRHNTYLEEVSEKLQITTVIMW